jgi:hypothetical protein
MVVLGGGGLFLMSDRETVERTRHMRDSQDQILALAFGGKSFWVVPSRSFPGLTLFVQGHLAHKKTPTPLGPPYDPRHWPTVGSQGAVSSCERGAPVHGLHGTAVERTRHMRATARTRF